MTPVRRAITLLVLLGGLAPIALVVVDVVRHAQNVPFWDEWADPLDIALHTVEGRLTPGFLLRQHSDSRPFFSNVLTAFSARVAGWSLKLEMFVSVALAGGTLVLVTSLYRATHPRSWLVVWIPFSALIFSLLQRRTWLWAVQSQYVFLILFVVASLWVVTRFEPGWRALLVAAALTLCATFSYANGFLMWGVMVPVLWMLGYRRWRYALVWAAATVMALGAYFMDFQFHVERGVTFDPLFLSRFVAVYLGNAFTVREVVVHPPLEIHLDTALGSIGLLGLAANVVLLWRARHGWRDVAPWVGMALFVVTSAALAGSGRRHMGGIEVATASRYVTLSTLFWVAFVALAMMAMTQIGATRRWVRDGNRAVMVVLLLVFSAGSWRFSGARPTITEAHRACFLAYPTSHEDGCFDDIHPSLRKSDPYGSSLLAKLEILARHKLAAFGEPPRP